MGYETGVFIDCDNGELHVEASGGLILVHVPDESRQILRLQPHEAKKLTDALELAMSYYFDSERS